MASVEIYDSTLTDAGITVLSDYIETTVVLDRHRVAGTFDRLVNVPGFELPLIADLKTGADLAWSWRPFAVQLAAYARAEAIYVQGPASDGSQDVRHPMPPIERSRGLIIHLPVGEAR